MKKLYLIYNGDILINVCETEEETTKYKYIDYLYIVEIEVKE